MTKWEYCMIDWQTRVLTGTEDEIEAFEDIFDGRIVESDGISLALGGFLKVMGSDQEAETVTKLSETISQLGLDGWEMVSHTEVTKPVGREVFFFKRPIGD